MPGILCHAGHSYYTVLASISALNEFPEKLKAKQPHYDILNTLRQSGQVKPKLTEAQNVWTPVNVEF